MIKNTIVNKNNDYCNTRNMNDKFPNNNNRADIKPIINQPYYCCLY